MAAIKDTSVGRLGNFDERGPVIFWRNGHYCVVATVRDPNEQRWTIWRALAYLVPNEGEMLCYGERTPVARRPKRPVRNLMRS